MLDVILDVAKNDARIRAVMLVGSRANSEIPKDEYQDYDITYFVTDIKPFYNQPAWIDETFGQSLIMQMPEAMRYPDGDGHFNYMMIFPDGNRLDLTFDDKAYIDDGEPAIILFDKDNGMGLVPSEIKVDPAFWHIKKPNLLYFTSCCNNFWWCLNNVAKGIARDELPYVMAMLNDVIRKELHLMIEWYIGTLHGFDLSVGKDGKYFKKYLPEDLYQRFLSTYSNGDYRHIWQSIFTMCDLFHELAVYVADGFDFIYHTEEEAGMRTYLKMIFK